MYILFPIYTYIKKEGISIMLIEMKKIKLLDNEENILCQLDTIINYEENDEEIQVYYIHPLTGLRSETPKSCLQGWSEQNENENNNWNILIENIINDIDLCQKLYDLEEIEYFI